MKKKLFIATFLLLTVIFMGRFFKSENQEEICTFCNPQIICNQTYYEDDTVLGLYTHKPMVPGHCLIVPKRHVSRFEDLTEEEVTEIYKMIKKTDKAVQKTFGTKHYYLLQKNGKEAGQSIDHVHFHYIPKKEGDYSVVLFTLKFLLRPLFFPISQDKMDDSREKIIASLD